MKFLNEGQAKAILGGCCPGHGPMPDIPPPDQLLSDYCATAIGGTSGDLGGEPPPHE